MDSKVPSIKIDLTEDRWADDPITTETILSYGIDVPSGDFRCIEVRGLTLSQIKPTIEFTDFFSQFRRTAEYVWFSVRSFLIASGRPDYDYEKLVAKREFIYVDRSSGAPTIIIPVSQIEQWNATAGQHPDPKLYCRRIDLVASILARLIFDFSQSNNLSSYNIGMGRQSDAPTFEYDRNSDKPIIWIPSANFALFQSNKEPIKGRMHYDDSDPIYFGWRSENEEDLWVTDEGMLTPIEDGTLRENERLLSFMCYEEFFDKDCLSLCTLLRKIDRPQNIPSPDPKSMPRDILPHSCNTVLYRLEKDGLCQDFLKKSFWSYLNKKYDELQLFSDAVGYKFDYLLQVSAGVKGPQVDRSYERDFEYEYLGAFVTIMIRAAVSGEDAGTIMDKISRDISTSRIRERLSSTVVEELQNFQNRAFRAMRRARDQLRLAYDPIINIAKRIEEAQAATLKLKQIFFDPSHGLFQYSTQAANLFKLGGVAVHLNSHIKTKSVHRYDVKDNTQESLHLKLIVSKILFDLLELSATDEIASIDDENSYIETALSLLNNPNEYVDEAHHREAIKVYKEFLGLAGTTPTLAKYILAHKRLKHCLHTQYKDFSPTGRKLSPIFLIAMENGAKVKVGSRPITLNEVEEVDLFKGVRHLPCPVFKYITQLIADIIHCGRSERPNLKLNQIQFDANYQSVKLSFSKQLFDIDELELVIASRLVNEVFSSWKHSTWGAFVGNFTGPLINFSAGCADDVKATKSRVGNDLKWILTRTGDGEESSMEFTFRASEFEILARENSINARAART